MIKNWLFGSSIVSEETNVNMGVFNRCFFSQKGKREFDVEEFTLNNRWKINMLSKMIAR